MYQRPYLSRSYESTILPYITFIMPMIQDVSLRIHLVSSLGFVKALAVSLVPSRLHQSALDLLRKSSLARVQARIHHSSPRRHQLRCPKRDSTRMDAAKAMFLSTPTHPCPVPTLARHKGREMLELRGREKDYACWHKMNSRSFSS